MDLKLKVSKFSEYQGRLMQAQRSLCMDREGDVLCFTSAGFISSFVGHIQQGDSWQALRRHGLYTTEVLQPIICPKMDQC